MSTPSTSVQSSTSVYKNVLKSSGIYVIAIVVQRLASVILAPVYTRYLDPAAYGTLELLDLTVGIFGVLMGSTFTYSLYYFHARAKDADARGLVISTSLFGAAALGIVGALIGFSLAPQASKLVFQTPQYAHYFHLSFWVFAGSLPLEMCYACLRAMDRPMAFTVASIGRLLVTATATLFFLIGLRWGVAGVICGNLTGTVTMAIILNVFCLRRVPPAMRRLRFSLFVAQLKYAAPSIFVGLSTTGLHSGDRYFLQRYVPMAQVGLYSFAYRGGMLISYCQQAFSNYWSAQVYAVIDHPDGGKIFSRLFTYFILVMVVVGLALAVFVGPAIILLTAPAYHAAIPFVPWVIAIYIVRAMGDFFRPVLYANRKTHLDARLNVVAVLICMAAYALLIPPFKAWGAIAATAFGFTTSGLYSWHLARKFQVFHLEGARLLRICGLALVDAGLVYHFSGTHLVGQVLGATAGMAAYPIALAASGFMTEGEKETLVERGSAFAKQARMAIKRQRRVA
jgi:O-antigen/teichoic acid export membrane protein